jgi:hypothetical protein
MDTHDISAPPRAQSRHTADKHPNQRYARSGHSGVGLTHDNARHTARFTVIGNHLAQHPELSALAIGLGVHIQSLPAGARVDIKTLAARFPEGTTRIAAALRELETHGYLRRERHRIPDGRIITRTISCNQPGSSRRDPHAPPKAPAAAPAAHSPAAAPRANGRPASRCPPYRVRRTRPRRSSSRPRTSWQASAATTPACSCRPATRPTWRQESRPGWSGTSAPPPYATPDGRSATRGTPPPRSAPGPPADRATAAPATVPRTGPAADGPAPAPELRPLRPRLPLTDPGTLPRLPNRSTGGRLA